MFCRFCGTELEETLAFCKSCGRGAELSAEAGAEEPHEVEEPKPSADKMPAADIAAVTAEEPQVRTGKTGRVLTAMASIFLCALIFICGSAAFLIYVIRDGTSKDAIGHAFEQITLSQIHVEDILGTPAYGTPGENITFAEWVYLNLNPYIASVVILEDVEMVIDESTLKTFIEGKAADYLDDLYNNSGGGYITTNEIASLVRRNASIIQSAVGYTPTENDYHNIAADFSEPLAKISMEALREGLGTDLAMLRWGLSYYMLAASLILTVLLTALIFIVNGKRLHKTSAYIGVTSMLAGAVYIIFGLTLSLAARAVFGMWTNLALIRALTSQMRSDSLVIGLSVYGFGLTLSVIYYLIKKLLAKNNKQKLIRT